MWYVHIQGFLVFFLFLVVFDIHRFVFLATMIFAYVVHKPHNMKRSNTQYISYRVQTIVPQQFWRFLYYFEIFSKKLNYIDE